MTALLGQHRLYWQSTSLGFQKNIPLHQKTYCIRAVNKHLFHAILFPFQDAAHRLGRTALLNLPLYRFKSESFTSISWCTAIKNCQLPKVNTIFQNNISFILKMGGRRRRVRSPQNFKLLRKLEKFPKMHVDCKLHRITSTRTKSELYIQ